ncbi:anthocyanidin 3-O-glucosyltransferase [Dendrobium catenatum]|uniref:Anthocyanidin 3-O-glucosyltransferase n=1 Tax=Dendrobium catenatum TaxID=906689 RepID=A0A2I0X4B2_9ASPA|nr:anthocyanidin 3-O-glucosyltransferase [Dendrobium catenatum]PKU82758.1 Anthocyanidin 3-O-glucosyltransferase [Dendrobium catenatum]
MANIDDAIARGSLHILMFPFVAFGHISPFLQLSRKLSAAGGIHITFLSTPANIPRISSLLPSSPSIRLHSLPLPAIPGLPAGAESTADLPQHTAELLKLAVDSMQPQVAALLVDLRPDLVFFDFAQPWLPSIAHPLGVKTLFFSVFSAAATAYLTVPSRRSKHSIANIAGELIRPPAAFPDSTALSAGVPAYQAADFSYIFRSSGDAGELSVLDRVLTGLTGCSAVVAKTCMEMESPYIHYIESQLGKPVLLAGPVVPESPAGSLGLEWTTFLDQFADGSVVFCSFGSETALSEEGVEELLLGLEMAGKPFLAVLKGGTAAFGKASADGSGARLVREGWAPQQLILGHRSVGCFVCHAGMSSLVEAVVSGCKLVLLPQRGDQYLNARLFAGDLGIGVEVEREESGGFKREAVRDAVVRVMEEEKGRESFDKWREFFMDGEVQKKFLEEFVEKLKELAYGKSSK